MSRIAGKPPVKASIKKLVVTSKSFDECAKKIHAVSKEYSDIEILRLWNRRSAFKKEVGSAKPAEKKQKKEAPKKKDAKKSKPQTDGKMSEAQMQALMDDLETTTIKLLEGLGIKIIKINS